MAGAELCHSKVNGIVRFVFKSCKPESKKRARAGAIVHVGPQVISGCGVGQQLHTDERRRLAVLQGPRSRRPARQGGAGVPPPPGVSGSASGAPGSASVPSRFRVPAVGLAAARAAAFLAAGLRAVLMTVIAACAENDLDAAPPAEENPTL